MPVALAAECAAVIVRQGGKRHIKEIAARQHDEVKTRRRFILTEEFTHSPFRSVPPDGTTQPAWGNDTQPTDGVRGRQPDEGHETTAGANAATLDLQELWTLPDPLGARQRPGGACVSHGAHSVFTSTRLSRDGEAMTPLRPPPAQHTPPGGSAHAYAKAVRLFPVAAVRLIGAFHLARTPCGRRELPIIAVSGPQRQGAEVLFAARTSVCYSPVFAVAGNGPTGGLLRSEFSTTVENNVEMRRFP